MKFPKKLLASGETVVFDVHHRPLSLFVSLLPAVMCVAIWLAGFILLRDFFVDIRVVAAFLAIFAVFLAYFAVRFLIWTHASFVLTDRRLIYRSGVFARRSKEVSLRSIKDVSHYQTFANRLFLTGDIIVQSTGEPRPIIYNLMPNPEQLKLKILEQSGEENGGADAQANAEHGTERPTREITVIPPERQPLYSEIVDQIERLDKMRERGVLTEQEFQEAKTGLLRRMGKEEGG